MANAQQTQARFHARRRIRIASAVLFCVFSAIYLSWRITIFNQDAMVLSSVFFAAEIMGVIIALCAIFSTSRHTARTAPAVAPGLDVDVLVPVYREPLDVIRRTVQGAANIDYPHRTLVLDDGRRPEVKEIAERFGCVYLSRERNLYAKAGNLAFGLKHSSAEFFVVFDADHIPLPHALHTLLGFFSDPEVALAQAPQRFYNNDCFQFCNARNGALWHDQSFFYHITLPNSDSANSTICIGTGAAYRRAAIDAIGGIPHDTVTEDLHTSLKLHKSGFKTVYINEAIAHGIGETRLSDYYKVRLRWAHGNIHALRHENVLFCKGLSAWQRLSYMIVGLNYLEGWQYLIFYLVPIYSLFTGTPPFEITLFNVLCLIFYPVVSYMLVQEFACGLGRFWVNELYGMARFPVAILATLALVRDKMAWRSSSKAMAGKLEWDMMVPQLGVIGLSMAALFYGFVINWASLEAGPLVDLLMHPWRIFFIDLHVRLEAGYNLDLLLVAGVWAVINIVRGMIFFRKVAWHARHADEDYSFAVPLAVELNMQGGAPLLACTKRISTTAVELEGGGDRLLQAAGSAGLLYLPDGPVPIRLEQLDAEQAQSGQAHDGAGRFGAGRFGARPCGAAFTFHLTGGDSRDRLEKCLYSVTWHRQLLHDDAEFMTPLQFIGALLRFTWPNVKGPDWRPVMAERLSGEKLLAYVDAGAGRMTAFAPLHAGEFLKLRQNSCKNNTSVRISAPGAAKLAENQNDGFVGPAIYCYESLTNEPSESAVRGVSDAGKRAARVAAK